MTDRELMQMVLKKLDHIWELGVEVESYKLSDDLLPEIKALRDRLAEDMPTKIFGPNLENVLNAAGFYKKREWVALTDEEIDAAVKSCNTTDTYKYFRAIEAKLKEKNT